MRPVHPQRRQHMAQQVAPGDGPIHIADHQPCVPLQEVHICAQLSAAAGPEGDGVAAGLEGEGGELVAGGDQGFADYDDVAAPVCRESVRVTAGSCLCSCSVQRRALTDVQQHNAGTSLVHCTLSNTTSADHNQCGSQL